MWLLSWIRQYWKGEVNLVNVKYHTEATKNTDKVDKNTPRSDSRHFTPEISIYLWFPFFFFILDKELSCDSFLKNKSHLINKNLRVEAERRKIIFNSPLSMQCFVRIKSYVFSIIHGNIWRKFNTFWSFKHFMCMIVIKHKPATSFLCLIRKKFY